jgi:hypothetical protein
MKSLASMQQRKADILKELETVTDVIYSKVLLAEYKELEQTVNNWGTEAGQIYRIM